MTLEFRTSILRVRITKSRIAVALYDCVHLYAFSVPPKKIAVYETGENPHGLVCLGETHIAVPGRSAGQVQLIKLDTGNVSILPAHTSPLSAMTFSGDGAVLATASQTVFMPYPSPKIISANPAYRGQLLDYSLLAMGRRWLSCEEVLIQRRYSL